MLKLFAVVCYKDGKDGHGLKLEKVCPVFSSFSAMPAKMTLRIISNYWTRLSKIS